MKKTMRTLIIYVSTHHGNTKKVAERMAPILEAKLVGQEGISSDELNKYDLIGFGSGIYAGKHHRNLINFIEKLPDFIGKKTFILSTCGGDEKNIEGNHKKLREKLKEKKFDIIGEFTCKGWDSFGPFKLVGGLNKERPNEEDFKKAENFANELKQKIYEKSNSKI